MKTIYYLVQKQLEDIDGFEEATGWKSVSIIESKDEKIKVYVILEKTN